MNPVNIPSMKLKVGELILRLWTVINSLRLTAENLQKLELCCFFKGGAKEHMQRVGVMRRMCGVRWT